VLRLFSDAGDPVAERPLPSTELAGASEVFATSSIRGVQPVGSVLEVGEWPLGPRTTWLLHQVGATPERG
jgi:branched-subunit amino acid aminotransferase/4-amino-4-deoxychorismate lyase